MRESFTEEKAFKQGLERWIKLFLKQKLENMNRENSGGENNTCRDVRTQCLVRVVQIGWNRVM